MQHASPISIGRHWLVAVIAILAVGAGFAGQAMAQDAASSLAQQYGWTWSWSASFDLQ